MRILDLLPESSIELYGEPMDQRRLLRKMTALMSRQGNLSDEDIFLDAVYQRESQISTNVGRGIAIPHAMSPCVTRPGLSAMVIAKGMKYGDRANTPPVKLVFLIAVPYGESGIHMQVLSRLSTMLMHEQLRQSLVEAQSVSQFLFYISQAEQHLLGSGGTASSALKEYDILAVTACPTGIAHTYMAAQALRAAAEQEGVSIKIETNGAQGICDRLTPQDIARCRCVIIAADLPVDMARFDGKPLLSVSATECIRHANELVEQAAAARAPAYTSNMDTAGFIAAQNQPPDGQNHAARFWHNFYKHMMRGVSMMLPFLACGGMLLACAFLLESFNIGDFRIATDSTFLDMLMRMGEMSLGVMLGVLSGYIAMSIGDKPAFPVGFVGGLIARDAGSGLVGALVAGFVAGAVILVWQRLLSKLPKQLDSTKTLVFLPVLGIISMGLCLFCVFEPPLVFINQSLQMALQSLDYVGDVVVGAIVAGMMAFDFGGPINKAAFLFAAAALADGETHVMAAVMAGGMVPPLVIGLCLTFCKKHFTKAQRAENITCFVTGMCFITEGALPYALLDPLRVIPSCVLGSSVAGSLSMLFDCGSRAPHGGIFVVGLMESPQYFLLSIAIGAVCGMITLTILKGVKRSGVTSHNYECMSDQMERTSI